MTRTTKRRRRVLIIGAGRRVQNNFLPALSCLSDRFDICGIHARTQERLLPVAKAWGIKPADNLANVDLAGVDVVAVSVPTAQNAPVLRQLLAKAKRLHLVIDTPIAWSSEERALVAPLLDEFAGVTVTEDYMNFPQFGLLRDAARQGLIGEVRSLTLLNIGYLYHGLALIRSFCGFGPVLESRRHQLGSHGSVVSYRFQDNFTGTIIGPYRRHTTGGALLEGSSGVITEFPVDREAMAIDKPVHVLSPVYEEHRISKFKIAFEDRELVSDLQHLRRMREMNFSDKSEINLLRGCGLIEVFLSVCGAHNINKTYGARNAFYDSFVSRRAERGETPLDPFDTFPKDASSALQGGTVRPISWIASCTTYLKGRMELASTLPVDERIPVRAGDIVVAQRSERQGDHCKLLEAQLNGQPLPKPSWFIYAPDWAEHRVQ